MSIKKIITGLTLSMLLNSGMVGAGPDKTTSLLIDTPASLFDLGVLRLDFKLNDLDFGPHVGAPWINYAWDDDKIQIRITSVGFFDGNKASGHQECLKAFATLRFSAGVKPITSKLYDSYDNSTWADLFNHINYSNKSVSNSLSELDKKFTLICVVVFSDDSIKGLKLESKLLSTTLSESTF